MNAEELAGRLIGRTIQGVDVDWLSDKLVITLDNGEKLVAETGVFLDWHGGLVIPAMQMQPAPSNSETRDI